jgi:isoquinoline 1-oxidoreductase
VPEAPRVSDYLQIDDEGAVTVFTGKAEVGQNIRTALAQVVAEELGLSLDRVLLVMADTARVPFDRGTFGSRSTPDMAPRLRAAAATARETLKDLAADRWEADTSALVVREGQVVHAETGQALAFGELARGQALVVPVADAPPVAPPERWTVAGTPAPKVNARAIVTGAHRYASDVARPGMLHGRVLRPPAYRARLVSVDAAQAAVPGVVVVHEGDFVGAAAPTAHAAQAAIAAVRADWEVPPQPSEAELHDILRTEPGDTEGGRQLASRSRHESGSVEQGLAGAARVLRATYSVAYIAHAPLEPRAAVAEWEGDSLTVWAGSQRPFGVQAELMAAFELPAERVRVVVPDTGAGYGGKHTGEAALEAARLARAAGRPVKVVWSREEEFTWAYFRPAGVMDLAAGLTADGALAAWEHHNYNAGASALRTPYEVPHQRSEFHPSRSPLRQGSYRALAATANSFARESFMDELAHAAGADPLAFRLRHLAPGRLRDVLEAAAERFGWSRHEPAPAQGIGLACSTEKGGYVATCALVAADAGSGALRVLRAVTAFECGAIVNPDGLRNQVEGAVVQGLGGALFEAIHFEHGRLLNPRFSQYRVPRFADVPHLETVLLNRTDLPSAGAGEAPLIAIAPAVANALFAATGERRRSLPLLPA